MPKVDIVDDIWVRSIGRLTKMSKIELENEAKELKATIATLTVILKTEESIKAKVSEELTDVEKKYASPRRTRLVA